MDKVKSVFLLVAALAFAASPLLTSGFNGFTGDQFPIPQNNPPVQPAGYAVSIWGLIYIWMIAGAVFGLLKRDRTPDWTPMRAPLILSLAIGAAWIPVANISPVWATVLIWLMWGSAALALLRTGGQDRLWQRTPVALYAGWLTAASCVALGLLLAGYGFVPAQVAAIAMIILALALTMAVQVRRRDTPEFSFAVIWALVGVIVANVATQNWAVVGLAAAGAMLLAYRAALPHLRDATAA